LAERVKHLEMSIEDMQFEKRTIVMSLKEQSSKFFETLRLNNVLLDYRQQESKVKELKADHASMGNEKELYSMMKKFLIKKNN
jgi:hypothetical protein